jgi:hypothetical protein
LGANGNKLVKIHAKVISFYMPCFYSIFQAFIDFGIAFVQWMEILKSAVFSNLKS